MTKSENVKVRIDSELKEQLKSRAEAENRSVSQIIERSIRKELEQSMSEEYSVYFSMPEQHGTTLRIGVDEFQIYPQGGRLTDGFLDEMIVAYKGNKDFSVQVSSDLEGSPMSIFCNDKGLIISTNGKKYEYPISLQQFAETFFENVRKYAIYWAAPANYKAMMYDNFDRFVARMQKYRDGEKRILDKLRKI